MAQLKARQPVCGSSLVEEEEEEDDDEAATAGGFFRCDDIFDAPPALVSK